MARLKIKPNATPARNLTHLLSTDLSKLLRSRAFALGKLSPAAEEWLTTNMQMVGGAVDQESSISVGESPTADGLSIGLGEKGGTLGPKSFGFLNNVDGVAALAAPLPTRPKLGRMAMVVPRRDALPEVVPLLNRRGLGISWLISVGDGDPSEAIQFLSMDPSTSGILVVLGKGARAASLQEVLGEKETVLLSLLSDDEKTREMVLCQAVARSKNVAFVEDLELGLAHGSLLNASFGPAKKKFQLVTVGAGADFVAVEAKRAGLPKPLILDATNGADSLAELVNRATLKNEVIILCTDLPGFSSVPGSVLQIDPTSPETLRAFFQILAQSTRKQKAETVAVVEADNKRLSALMQDLPSALYESSKRITEEILSDHDTKRLLHAYGIRVTKQAPANTSTAALRVAEKIGFPVDILSEKKPVALTCRTASELKRQVISGLSGSAYVMVRESIESKARIDVVLEKHKQLGTLLRVADAVALLPLSERAAFDLAEQVGGEQVMGLATFLGQISGLLEAEALVKLALTVSFIQESPVVVEAAATLKRA